MNMIRSAILGAAMAFCISTAVFAAGASMQGSTEKTAKGKEISGNTLTVTLAANEVKAAADTIHIVLNGAEWKRLEKTGSFAKGVEYEKLSQIHTDKHTQMLPFLQVFGLDYFHF